MKRRALPAGVLAALTVVGGLAFAPAAYATHVTCGMTITTNTTLDSAVGPCANNGIAERKKQLNAQIEQDSDVGLPPTAATYKPTASGD